jgi:hypothetical protein
MTTRTDIMDPTGAPRELTDLTGEEVRALRALAEAGMIAPLGAAAPHASAAPHAGTPHAGTTPNAGAAPRGGTAPRTRTTPQTGTARPRETRPREAQEVQGTLMAA